MFPNGMFPQGMFPDGMFPVGLAPANDIVVSPAAASLVITGLAPAVAITAAVQAAEQRGGGSRKKKRRQVYTLPNGTRVVTDEETYRRLIADADARAVRTQESGSIPAAEIPPSDEKPQSDSTQAPGRPPFPEIDDRPLAALAALPPAVAEAFVAEPGRAAAEQISLAAERQKRVGADVQTPVPPERTAAVIPMPRPEAAKPAPKPPPKDDLMMLLLMEA